MPPTASCFRPRVFALGSPEPAIALAAAAARRDPCLLDSAGGRPARWSVLGFDPLVTGAPAPRDLSELRALVLSLERGAGDPPPGPFHGGFLGALAYDLGVHGERLALPAGAFGGPPIAGGLYTDFVVLDHAAGQAWLVLGDGPGDGRPSVEERRASVVAALAEPPPFAALRASALEREVAPEVHRERVERVRALIAQGEIYQANLAHRYRATTRGHPFDLYLRLRAWNAAPYMAYLAWGGTPKAPGRALLSASPELLLEFDGVRARTRPIKGTVERGATPEADEAAVRALSESEKDLAELAMIVDLERNDLGRVARPGSVVVPRFPEVESYASVHHLVADVVAEPRPGLDAFDLLAALFPGGSISGAPKLRAMEVIAELEGQGRGFFSGSAGFLDTRGRAVFDILIRTLEWRSVGEAGEGELGFHVGGGVTWRSDPVAEERETRSKGATLAGALAGPGERPDTLGVDVPGHPPAVGS